MKSLTTAAFGIKMPDTLAKSLDALLKTLPKECQSLRRKATTPDSTEVVKGERADVSMVSVESVDREGDVVLAKGVDLTYFQKNPIVTFAHKYDELPVGKAQWIKSVPGGIKAKTSYATRPDTWEGSWLPDAILALIQQGILKGKSIGFLPTKIRQFTREETKSRPDWTDATCVESCVLLEYACCALPVNQDALVEVVSKGLCDLATLKRLGLSVPKNRKTVDKLALFLKGLESIKINPQEIAEQVMQRLAARGKV